MSSILRFLKPWNLEPLKLSCLSIQPTKVTKQNEVQNANVKKGEEKGDSLGKKTPKEKWKCMNNCFRGIGYLCTAWWLVLFLYHCLPCNLVGFQLPESPGQRLKKSGLNALHPVVLVPGIVTGGLELWEGKPCSKGLFRKRLWGGSFSEIFKRPMCWLEHLSLDNETGLDPPGIRVRPVSGLVAADYFAPGYFVWAVLIENLANIGYEERNLHMAAYDWRLSFQNTEVRDRSLSILKSKIELMYLTNGNKKVVVVPHSMGANYFLHFLKWVESPPPMGGGGGLGWCAKYIKAIMNIGPVFLGVPKIVANILSAEDKGIALLRAMASGVFDSEIFRLQTLEHAMRVSRTWDSMISLFPRGGETIWGDLDSSPEIDQECDFVNKKVHRSQQSKDTANNSDANNHILFKENVNYGRIISFGNMASTLHSSQLPNLSFKEFMPINAHAKSNTTCRGLLTEYDELSREIISEVAEHKAYTAKTVLDLIRFVAPKMMQRAEGHFSHGIADDLDDPKYTHYKYWSNPLETRLPDAPDLEIYCLYGVGIPTERSYVYKLSPLDRCKTIPYRIDSSANDSPNRCLKGGVYFSDGDESVPLISAGFMCARGWRGKTRFNPSGAATHVREYQHKPPLSLLEGRGSESGAHVDIMGNVALIEDVLRVAAGATGEELGGDRIISDIMEMSRRIELQL